MGDVMGSFLPSWRVRYGRSYGAKVRAKVPCLMQMFGYADLRSQTQRPCEAPCSSFLREPFLTLREEICHKTTLHPK